MSECNTELLQEIFDRGLSPGLGAEDDQMCVEAAIALACGEPFSDRPTCVAEPDRTFSIKLNDANWSSPEVRAKALLPLALAQLGTAGTDRTKWVTKVVEDTIRSIVPKALRAAAKHDHYHSKALLSAAQRCEDEGSQEAAKAAARAAYDADAPFAAFAAANYAADAAADATKTAAYAAIKAAQSAAAKDTTLQDSILQEAVDIALDSYAKT